MTELRADLAALERKQIRRRKRWMKRLAVTGALIGLAVGGWAFEDDAPQGLKGILPAEVPYALSAEAFEPLGPTWRDWSQTATDAIADLYKLEGDVAAQKAALAKVKVKLGVLDKAIADGKYVMIHQPLASLRGPLARRVALADAVLTTLETDADAARKAAVDATGSMVSKAVASLKSDLQSVPGGSAWLPFVHIEELQKAWSESQDSAAAVAALNSTRSRLAMRETLTDESQKEFLSRPAFLSLQEAIDDHLQAVTLKSQPVDLAQVRASLGELMAAIEDFETYSSTVDAGKVHAAIAKLRSVAPDGGAAIQAAVDEHYLNKNLRIVASEAFLNRLLSDSRVEQGRVSDYVLGASVGGSQTTSTKVSVDVKPSSDRILFNLILSGTVQSSTAGSTSQATIYTQGYHTFSSTKAVAYDGEKFTTGPASTYVNANNTTTGATTRFSGGLFGRYAERVAMREAASRRPQAESIAEGRISGRVTPRFNDEVDTAFAKATDQLNNDLIAGMKAAGIYPEQQQLSSFDDRIAVATRFTGDGKLGGDDIPEAWLSTSRGAAMLLHESAVNNTIDQIGFSGKKMDEAELRAHLEGFLSKALSREFKFQSPTEAEKPAETVAAAEEGTDDADEKTPAKLVFTQNDPVRIQFRNGRLVLVIRAGLERENAEPIPAHEIIVPLTMSVQGEKIVIRRDSLQIAPIEGELKPLQQRVMNSRISRALPDREVEGTFKLKGPSREVQAQVTSIQLVDGWIAVHVQ